MDNNQEILNKDKDHLVPMFDSIAWRYDFLNHILSFGIDRSWRGKAISKISGKYLNPKIIDVATGTGDFAIAALKLDPSGITGIDISENMLSIAGKKAKDKGLSDIISFINCDSENICFEDNTFDVAIVAFGVRNFADPGRGLSEMNRVIRNGGMAVILEFSKPERPLFKQIYNFYFRDILPFIGKKLSKDRSAYRYLNESVIKFPDNEEFMVMMRKAGFLGVTQKKLTLGVASIYSGFKE